VKLYLSILLARRARRIGALLFFTLASAAMRAFAPSIFVNEATTTGTIIYTAADQVAGKSYALVGTDAASFTINASGNVKFVSVPDYETKTSYTFTINTYSGAVLHSTEDMVVYVNNLPPIITSSSSTSVSEGVPISTTIYTAAASDPAGGTVTYSLSGTDAASFSINSATGELKFNSVPNFESKSSYSVNVVATDPGSLFGTKAVTVSVINVAPSITSGSSASVNEGVSGGTTVYTVTATDPGGGTITYSLTAGGDAASFLINASTGEVSINSIPNFETKSSYTFNTRASDSGGLSNTKAVTVNVINLAPVISSAASASVNEGVSAGTTVYIVVASDPGGGTVTYTVTGTDAAAFSINSSTGEVTINTVPNSQVKSSYSFDARAADSSNLFATKTVTINVTAVPPPDLSITRATDSVVLSWPVTFRTYSLERTVNLTTTNWATITNVVVVNGRNWVTNDFNAPAGFFRLR